MGKKRDWRDQSQDSDKELDATWGVKEDESRKAAEFFLELESLRQSLQYTFFQVKSPHCLPQKIQ